MATIRGKRKLVCFYCNGKSKIVYDGIITQWECAKCDAMNYLDQNGETTDPPVATDYAAPSNRQYAIPQADYEPSSQGSDTTIFCSTCQKNQHLYRASLQQFDVELDPYNPRYRESEKAYYNYKKDLEKRYPQVCEDCEPKALERMKVAKRTAQADWLGRKLRDTKSKKFNGHVGSISFFDILKIMWFMGVIGHLAWNAMTLIAASLNTTERKLDTYVPSYLLAWLEPIISLGTSDTWAWQSLVLSLLSSCWNPKIKEAMAGGARLQTHINGYRVWYELQFIMIATRSLVYYFMGKGILSDRFSPAAIGAHLASLIFNILLTLKLQRTLKVDHSPLWKNVESFHIVGPGSQSNSPKGGGSMEDILNEISTTPVAEAQNSSPSPPSSWDHSPPSRNYNNRPLSPSPLRNENQLATYRTRSQTDMMPHESGHGLGTGNSLGSLQIYDDRDQMDWSPVIPQTQHRAFNTPRSLQGSYNSQLFGQTPVAEKSSVFWAKVPPAPISQAHRLRNPPNQPRLRVSSQEVKENFFNNITRKKSVPDQTAANGAVQPRHEVEFSQQKFFAPIPPSEEADSLADTFKGFSLSSREEAPRQKPERQIRVRPLVSLFLAIGLLYAGMEYVKGNISLSKGWAL